MEGKINRLFFSSYKNLGLQDENQMQEEKEVKEMTEQQKLDSYKANCPNCIYNEKGSLGEPDYCVDLSIYIFSPDFYCQHHEFKEDHVHINMDL